MKPQRRQTEFPFGLLGAAAWVEFQPKGVVGIVSPWNFPVGMAIGPLAGVLAAGNRAMLKPSEYTPATSELLARMMAEAFDQDEVSVINGGPEVGAAFTRLPFDHLLFTGATSIGRHVMRAAADNLVPVTLELGGKSPVILGRSANLEKAALRIMHGKVVNAGQICVAPDYVFAPTEKIAEFVAQAKAAVRAMLPSGARDNKDYTSIINQKHYDRLRKYLDDAKSKGAELIEINPNNEDLSRQPHHIMLPVVVLNPTDEMTVMQEEIFGPILPIKTYDKIGDAIEYINSHDRPLSLYYFGEDKSERKRVLSSTISGGVTVNDVIFHVAQEDLPFGGSGASGMGSYHGQAGFYEFSHKKSVYRQTPLEIVKMLRPPYTDLFRKQIDDRIKN
jgi:coniferyl-aldehyde dehydrogenase